VNRGRQRQEKGGATDDVTVLSLCGEGLRFRSESQGHPGHPTEATDSNRRDLVKCLLDVCDAPGESECDRIGAPSIQAVGVPHRVPEAEFRPNGGCLLSDSFGATPDHAFGDQSSIGPARNSGSGIGNKVFARHYRENRWKCNLSIPPQFKKFTGGSIPIDQGSCDPQKSCNTCPRIPELPHCQLTKKLCHSYNLSRSPRRRHAII